LGISLGGMGAVLYTDYYPDEVEGLILLAPYTGDKKLGEHIAQSGGLMAWDGEADAGEDFERRAWRTVQRWVREQEGRGLVLAYGESDSFAEANRLIGEVLPEGQYFTRPGRHNWSTWLPLWQTIMDEGLPLPADRAL